LTSDREAARAAFLQRVGLGGARREPLAGDASTRRYERLHPARGDPLIFMDQPPSAETAPCPPRASPAERAALGYNALARLAAGRIDAFIACGVYLRSLELSAPEVLDAEPAAGFAVLEDLGDDLFARAIARGAAPEPLYDAAIDVLARLHAQAPPDILTGRDGAWPLLVYDDLALQTAGGLFLEWLPKLHPRLHFDAEARQSWERVWAPWRARAEAQAGVFCHRDFHAENLIWLPEREGTARVGLLDFQDAVRAHPAWDLSMLLHDARRDVSPELEAAALDRYFDLRPGVAREAFVADYHALGALNMARILGLFARLIVRDHKPRYRAFMPRLWTYLDSCLADPALAPLAAWFARHVPPAARSA
jgi:aminoglycoside/choline kinase family phosphotransferase